MGTPSSILLMPLDLYGIGPLRKMLVSLIQSSSRAQLASTGHHQTENQLDSVTIRNAIFDVVEKLLKDKLTDHCEASDQQDLEIDKEGPTFKKLAELLKSPPCDHPKLEEAIKRWSKLLPHFNSLFSSTSRKRPHPEPSDTPPPKRRDTGRTDCNPTSLVKLKSPELIITKLRAV